MVQTIAQQCPYAGGKAVYQARVFIKNYYTDTLHYDDVATCLQQGIYRNQNLDVKQDVTVNDFTLHPNPANDKIEIAIKNNIAGVCKLELFNNLGATVMERTFNCEQKNLNLDISTLVTGMYYVKITFNHYYSFAAKLAIIR